MKLLEKNTKRKSFYTRNLSCYSQLTLYFPKLETTQEITASLPDATVTFLMSSTNSGSLLPPLFSKKESVVCVEKKQTKLSKERLRLKKEIHLRKRTSHRKIFSLFHHHHHLYNLRHFSYTLVYIHTWLCRDMQ